MKDTVYQLKVTLKNIKPPVWRRVLVPDCTLDHLHEILQVIMGWDSCHLYSFDVGGEPYTRPDMDAGELGMDDSTRAMLSAVAGGPKAKLIYTYDFGDDWRHEVVVEKVLAPEKGQKLPMCVKGSRACPPEDVGGPWGYGQYLEAMANPKHKQHKEFMQWRGKFDPEAFDVDKVNGVLLEMFG